MNIREITISIAILGAGFISGAYYGSGIFADLERVSLRERLEERRKERDEARAERDEAKKKYDDLHEQWERERRRPFRSEPLDPAKTVSRLDHDSWECVEP